MANRKSGEPGPKGSARDAALRLLTRRSHSRAELGRKLSGRGYPAEEIAAVLAECERGGYLDDAAVAGRWADVLVDRRCWGPQKVAAYLYERGIAEDIIDRVQQRVWQLHDETATARRALAKRFAAPAPKEKKIRFLLSRGFSAGVIYALQRELPDDRTESE